MGAATKRSRPQPREARMAQLMERLPLVPDSAFPDSGSAPGTIRTCDLCLRRAALYPLSYGRGEGECSCVALREP